MRGGTRLRTCSRSFRGSHWSAIGMSGCFGCAAWARAHASSRGAKAPSSSARFHSNPAGKCLAGRSAAEQSLPIARAIGGAPRLASHPGKVLVQLQKDFEQVLRACGQRSGPSGRRWRCGPAALQRLHRAHVRSLQPFAPLIHQLLAGARGREPRLRPGTAVRAVVGEVVAVGQLGIGQSAHPVRVG